MENSQLAGNSIEQYILQFPRNVQLILFELKAVIKKVAPTAEERIRYQIPTFYLNGNLVHFAAYKNHIGFYPAPSAIEAFKEKLKKYKTSKGSVQFPLDKPLPLDLISSMVSYRVRENMGNDTHT